MQFVSNMTRTLTLLLLAGYSLPACAAEKPNDLLPASWRDAWNSPPAADRPLQIVHGIRPRGNAAAKPGENPLLETMRFYQDRGLGGVVCNVDFDNYLQSAAHWQTLADAVEACAKLGLVVWLYDEHGYPSGAAGGRVLEKNRDYEALALAFDPRRADPFLVRPAYEHTHASNNYHAARRYINLIDDRAVRCFLDVTHEAYRQRLARYFGTTIEAVFTDEPSLITVNLGAIPEEARRKVPVVDPLDPSLSPLPAVPWSYDLAERYRQRWGEDLTAARRSLFEGDQPADRRTRQQFWSLISDLVATRYFGAIQDWCRRNRLAATGHALWEEAILHHVALEGNGLKALSFMDIPGLDMLSSDPEAVIHSGWMTAALPSSAALLGGRRRVMTEISDFSQKMSGAGPARLDAMQAAAAWQAAWGVTDFTLYYGPTDRSADEYRAYCQFVGRMNAVLKRARFEPEVLLYYPVYDLWAEYRPVAAPLELRSQSPRAQRIVNSFMRLGQWLQRAQVPFALVDHELLAGAASRDGSLEIKGHLFRAVVLPEDVQLPGPAAAVLDPIRSQGLTVLRDGANEPRLTSASLRDAVEPSARINPRSERIALGRFTRDDRSIWLAVNVGTAAYQGQLATGRAADCVLLDPARGTVRKASVDRSGHLDLSLAGRAAVLIVQGSKSP